MMGNPTLLPIAHNPPPKKQAQGTATYHKQFDQGELTAIFQNPVCLKSMHFKVETRTLAFFQEKQTFF